MIIRKRAFCICMFLGFLACVPSANAEHYLSGQSSVDNGEIRWGSTTQYTWERDDAINTWNAIDPINILPDNVWTVEDLTFKDVDSSAYPWYGSWQQQFAADSLFLNIYHMDYLTYDERRYVVTHELGHALGLDHSVSGNVMYDNAFRYTLGSQDLSDYHYLWNY
jgi:hypothetical protein